jgi:hypothetical protein
MFGAFFGSVMAGLADEEGMFEHKLGYIDEVFIEII